MQAQVMVFFDRELVEKVLLVTLATLIFARILPGASAHLPGLELGVVVLIVCNAALCEWLTRRGFLWRSTLLQFLSLAFVNGAMALALMWLEPGRLDLARAGLALVFVELAMLLIVLYDRYQPVQRSVSTIGMEL